MIGNLHIDLGRPVSNHDLNRGLVAWWLSINQGPYSSGARFLDLAGRYHGTLTNGTTWRGSLGRPGGSGCLDFSSGITTTVTHAQPAALVGCAAMTIACWIKVNPAAGGSNSFFGKWDGGGGNQQHFSRFNGGMEWFLQNNANSAQSGILIGSGSITTGVWNHFCFTADGTNQNAYLNGVVAASPVGFAGPYIPTDSLPWNIGFGRSDSSLSQHDDHRYWSRALSAGDVFQIYSDSLVGYPQTLNRVRSYSVFDLAAPPAGGAFSIFESPVIMAAA